MKRHEQLSLLSPTAKLVLGVGGYIMAMLLSLSATKDNIIPWQRREFSAL